jgi:Uma2 family endonuclease
MSVMPLAADSETPDVVRGPFTRAELAGMPDDGRRYEIIDGVLIVSAAPGRMHQRAAGRLARLLVDACPAEFEVLIGPFAVGLADDTEIQPDIIVGRDDDFTEREIARPALAGEVLSPSTRLFDTHVKRARLERAGCPSYWVVDPVARPEEAALVAWELDADGAYRQVAKVVGDEPFRASLPFPVTVVPAALVR